ncbi:hypothetical protein A9G29_11770 [Gilliamella sp. Fer2-1]|jgi:hypothetical protein|nr:hypothetical protein A9G29_11770 [Gilliamella apicola]
MLEIVTYLSWQVSHNYKHLVVLFFVSIFCLFYWYYCKAKPVLHYIIPILFFMTCRIHDAGALSATTADVIHGHAPYLTFDGGATKSDIKALLGIKLPDGREYVPEGGESGLYPNAEVDVSSEVEPIMLPHSVASFENIQTLVPISGNWHYPAIYFDRLIGANNYWGDEDGDGSAQVSGFLLVKWENADNKDITSLVKNNPTKVLDPCDAPFKFTLSVHDGKLSTKYGMPRTNTFNEVSHTYYISPMVDKPYTCHAQPNLWWSSGDELESQWDKNKGFIVTSGNDLTTAFPTTGSNGLHFYLLLAGITPQQVIDVNGKTVSTVNGSGTVNLLLTPEHTPGWAFSPKRQALKIQLIGPTKDSSDKSFTPAVFKLYSNSSHSQLLYSFKIERWYIAHPHSGSYAIAQAFCHDLGNGYRVPHITDYTNANNSASFWTGGILGRDINEYRRQLSYKYDGRWIGGLFNEWGKTDNSDYPAASDWHTFYRFWASNSYSNYQYGVSENWGSVNYAKPSTNYHKVACVTP